MSFDPPSPAKDRRVRRTRAALLGAAVALVTERGTANIPVSDIADAAGVSRQLVYLHYGDRDNLLLEAALDLARTDLAQPRAETDELIGRERALAVARHFAAHRGFYRAMFCSAGAFALNKAVSRALAPLPARYGADLPAEVAEDLAVFVANGATALIAAWVSEGAEPLDPESMADRLLAVGKVIATAIDALPCPEAPPGG